MKTCLIYVNYFCSDAIHQSILSIGDLNNIDIYIADNSGDYVAISVEKDVRTYENIGYLPAFLDLVNQHIQREEYKFLILSNPDIVFDQGFFENLSKQCVHKNTAIIGPKIIENEIVKGIFIRNTPSIFWFFKQLIIHSSKITYSFARYYKTRGILRKGTAQVVQQKEVFAVHGSLMIFASPGMLKLPVKYFGFLYSEELFLGLHYGKLGMKTVYCPLLKVYHSAKETTGTLGSELQRKYIFMNTLKMFKDFLSSLFKNV